MSTTNPRECCWACEAEPDHCRDVHCACHDFIAVTDLENGSQRWTNFDGFEKPVTHFGSPRAIDPDLARAHERTRQKMRAKRLAKLHGKRPRVHSNLENRSQ